MPMRGGLYQGVTVVQGLIDDDEEVTQLDELLDAYVSGNIADRIVGVVMVPTEFVSDDGDPQILFQPLQKPTKESSLRGYVPRNAKLYTYPYCYLNVDCLNDSKDFRFEWFADTAAPLEGRINFALVACVSPTFEITLYPMAYNAVSNSANPTEALIMNGFPQCAYSIDSYRAWVAQRSNWQSSFNIAGSVLGGLGAMMAGANPVIAGASAAMAVGAQISRDMGEYTKGARVRGAIGGSNDVAFRAKNFYFKYMCSQPDYLRAIDAYFDRYGYATRRLKVPNRNVRPHWTYTKTSECTIRGAVPADAMSKINSIYNNGITFWRNASEVGNYSLDNSPV